MNEQNVEQKETSNSNAFSTLINTFVAITVVIVIVLPFIKRINEMIKQKFNSNSNSSSSTNSNNNKISSTPSPIQGFYNSQNNSNESGSSAIQSYNNNSNQNNNNNNNQNGQNQQSIQRSQNIQQWNDRNERFKQIFEQDNNDQLISIEDINQQIKKFIGQKISFNNKNVEPDCYTFDYLMQIILDNKHLESAIDLFNIFLNAFSKFEIITPNIISLFMRTIQYGLNNQLNADEANLMVDRLNAIVDKYEIKMTEGSIIATIDIALRTNKLEKAMKILSEFERYDDQNTREDFQKKKCELYYQILKNLKGISYSDIDDIIPRLRRMIEFLHDKSEVENIYPDEGMVNSLIDLCFQSNQAKAALEVYEYFERFNILPSSVTYCILIKGYGQLKQYNYAMTIYQQMKNNKIPLNEVTLGCLIDTCVKCNKLSRAEEILNEEKEIKPNTIIYTTLLKGYTKAENMAKALEIFEKMKSDKDLEPNIVSYNSLMECAVQCKEKEWMKKIFTEIMEQKDESKKADLITFSTYIKGLFKQGDIEEALEIFENLRKQEQYKLDEIFYNSILDGLFKARSYDKTQLLYQKMRQDNIKPSNVTYSILIKLNSAQDKIDNALNILQEMKTMNVKPGLIVYTCLIQACIKHKRIYELLPLYEDMKKHNVKGDPVFYNTLVSGLMFNYCINDALKMTIDTLERKIILNQEVYQNLLMKVVKNYEKRKVLENKSNNSSNNDNHDEEQIEETRQTRSYSGSIKFTSQFGINHGNNNLPNLMTPEEDQLTFEEMEKYLQKILLLLKNYQIEIDIDLYKQVINHIYVNNNDQKKEYLNYVSQKGNAFSRQNWGQSKPQSFSGNHNYGQSYNNNNYKNENGSNNSNLTNKNKSYSFQQRKRQGEGYHSQIIGEQSNSSYHPPNKPYYRNNGGSYNNSNSNNNNYNHNHNNNDSFSSNSNNNKNNSFFNRSHASSVSSNTSNKSQNQQNYANQRFIQKPKTGISISDMKNQLEQNLINSNSNANGNGNNNGGQPSQKNSILSNNSERSDQQDQLLLEKNLDEFEKDSENSFSSSGNNNNNSKNTTQNKRKSFKKSVTQSKFSHKD